eukprot:2907812-Prymnesium_polylepis.1
MALVTTSIRATCGISSATARGPPSESIWHTSISSELSRYSRSSRAQHDASAATHSAPALDGRPVAASQTSCASDCPPPCSRSRTRHVATRAEIDSSCAGRS